MIRRHTWRCTSNAGVRRIYRCAHCPAVMDVGGLAGGSVPRVAHYADDDAPARSKPAPCVEREPRR